MKNLTLLLLSFVTFGQLNAQTLEDELGFIYVKAEYLLETNRYEESIAEFTKIVAKDPAFKDVLYKRASAKYAIAAYLGAKNDILKSFEYVGVSPEAILLYGEALKNLGETGPATKTLETASMLNAYKSHQNESGKKGRSDETRRNNDHRGGGQTDGGTDSDTRSDTEVVEDNSDTLKEKIGTILDDILGRENENTDSSGGSDSDTSTGDSDVNNDPVIIQKPVYVPDMRENRIYIDEDLTILIKDGLGGRKVLDQPNIIILNETAGKIVVDVCVNGNGKVLDAIYNQEKSTLLTQSLVSLAVRKSKDFWFEKSDQEEICGSFVFVISARQ